MKTPELTPEAKRLRDEYLREWKEKNREQYNEYQKEYQKEYRKKNPEKIKQHRINYWNRKAKNEADKE